MSCCKGYLWSESLLCQQVRQLAMQNRKWVPLLRGKRNLAPPNYADGFTHSNMSHVAKIPNFFVCNVVEVRSWGNASWRWKRRHFDGSSCMRSRCWLHLKNGISCDCSSFSARWIKHSAVLERMSPALWYRAMSSRLPWYVIYSWFPKVIWTTLLMLISFTELVFVAHSRIALRRFVLWEWRLDHSSTCMFPPKRLQFGGKNRRKEENVHWFQCSSRVCHPVQLSVAKTLCHRRFGHCQLTLAWKTH